MVWYGTLPPVPTCYNCGATAKQNLPVIETTPNPKRGNGYISEYTNIRNTTENHPPVTSVWRLLKEDLD